MEKKVNNLIYGIIGLRFIDLFVILLLSYVADLEVNYVSLFTSTLFFCVCAYFLIKGYRWPLFLWALGCVLSLISMFAMFTYFGKDIVANFVVIFDSVIVILLSGLVFYMLANKDVTTYLIE